MSSFANLFPRGAEWVRVDFHLHTRADKQFVFKGDSDDFRKQFVTGLKEAGIALGVITNHNKFDVEEFRGLQSYAASQEIKLLPGVELSIGDGQKGIHTLIVFSDDWLTKKDDYINPFLTTVFEGKLPSAYEHEDGRTVTNIDQTIKKLNACVKDYFLVFAHVEDGSGLWKEMSGGRIQELGENSFFRKATLGFQKVRSYDKTGKDIPCRAKTKKHLRDFYPAEVEGSDPKSISEIGKGEPCYLKLGELSFESVKFALCDHQQRVRKESSVLLELPRLHEIRFTGGKLAGQSFPLSNELTSFIGSRGSGKSSVLECLRFGLGLEAGDSDLKYKSGLVAYVMANGAQLSITGKLADGREFEVTRSLNLPPAVFVEGEEIQLRPSLLLPSLLYFGQKDLGNRQDGFEDGLFGKLVGRRAVEDKAKEELLLEEIKEAAQAWNAVRHANTKVKEYEEEEEKLRLQLEVYRKKGVEKQLVKQTTFEADKRNIEDLVEQLEEFQTYMESDPDEWETLIESWPQLKSESLSNENSALAALLPELEGIREDYSHLLTKIEKLVEKARAQLKEVRQKEKTLQEEFLALQREIDAPGLNLQEFRNLKTRHEKLAKLIAAAKSQKTSISIAFKTVISSARKLHDLRAEWHREELEVITNTNKILPDSLELVLNYEGNREAFTGTLKEMVRGQGVRSASIDKIVAQFPNGLSLAAEFKEVKELLNGSTDVGKLREAIREDLASLVSAQTPDVRRILFNKVPIDDLSLGQRATALLQLLMSLDEHPIFIIDQPEDDLDNETIFREVVGPLLERKKFSQFIIATHNPNIPVLGDAELVHACREADNGLYNHSSGSLDSKSTREQIVSIMEGGARAFQKRQEIYNQWTNLPSEKNC